MRTHHTNHPRSDESSCENAHDKFWKQQPTESWCSCKSSSLSVTKTTMLLRTTTTTRAAAATTRLLRAAAAARTTTTLLPQLQQPQQQRRREYSATARADDRLVIAVGGNALQRRGERLTIENMLKAAADMAPTRKYCTVLYCFPAWLLLV